MERWGPSDGFIPSFISRFSDIRRPPPRDRTKSDNTITLSALEIAQSATSLHQLCSLDVNNLRPSSDHDRDWALQILNSHGPVANGDLADLWISSAIASNTLQISSEGDARRYFEATVLRPAISAAITLYAHHLRLSADSSGGFPDGYWELADNTDGLMSSNSDLSLALCVDTGSDSSDNHVVIMEGKTRNGCSCDRSPDSPESLSIFQHVGKWLQDHPAFPLNAPELPLLVADLNWYEEGGWQRKAQEIFFPHWHQLACKQSAHSIVFNQQEFVLCCRSGNALSVSKTYDTASQDPSRARETMVDVSYFMAHAMAEKFPSVDTTGIPASVRVGLVQSGRGSGSDERRQFSTDSASANVAPTSLIFTISGEPSPPLSLAPLAINSQNDSDSRPSTSNSTQTQTLILSRVQLHSRHHVCRGYVGGISVFAKMAMNGSEEYAAVQHEATVYEKLRPLQGIYIPKCFGTFMIHDFAFLLLLQDCGNALSEFSDLNEGQREQLLCAATEIHRMGVLHDDLEPRNVVLSPAGDVRIIDFESAETHHRCAGLGCGDLIGLRAEIENEDGE